MEALAEHIRKKPSPRERFFGYDITFTNAAGGKVGFRGNRPLDQLRPAILEVLHEAYALRTAFNAETAIEASAIASVRAPGWAIR